MPIICIIFGNLQYIKIRSSDNTMFCLSPSQLQGFAIPSDSEDLSCYQSVTSTETIQKSTTNDFDEFLLMIQDIVLRFNCEHPAIVPIKGYCIEHRSPTSFTVYKKVSSTCGTLGEYIERESANGTGNMTTETLVGHLYRLVLGLEYLHRKKIVHRRIDPSSLLMVVNGMMRLSDLSLGMFVADEEASEPVHSKVVGARMYQAPELTVSHGLIRRNQLYKADVWSLGLVIVELGLLKTGLVPALTRNKSKVVEGYIEQVEKLYGDSIGEVLRDMLCFEPDKRKTASEVIMALEERFPDILVYRDELRIAN